MKTENGIGESCFGVPREQKRNMKQKTANKIA
jgi:hypothetical protein